MATDTSPRPLAPTQGGQPGLAEVLDLTPRCIAVTSKSEAARWLWMLALESIPVTLAADAGNGKVVRDQRWHVSVPTWAADLPVIWIMSIRGEAYGPSRCAGDRNVKHTLDLA